MFDRTIATGLLAAALLAPALPASVPAQVTGVTVRVDGLSCPFCAYSLEKKLKEVDGVENLVIHVDEGVAIFEPAEGQGADFDVLSEVVKKAGFTPRGIHVQGIGRVETVSGRMVLVSKDGTPLFLLEANDVLSGLAPRNGVVYDVAGSVVAQTEGADASTLPRLELSDAKPRDTKRRASDGRAGVNQEGD